MRVSAPARPNLVFAGHTDVVAPGDEARWTHGPFAGDIEGGVLYGRGAVDMKGAIACQLAAALDHLAANGGRPKGSISFLITGDEESIAVNGTVKLLQWAAERGEAFDHCILGEPSNHDDLGDMIKIGRRGSLNGTLIVEGRQGHVAYPNLADNPVRRIVAIMSAMMAEPLDSGSAHFDPSNLEFTSVDVGNKTVNVIPAEARGRFNIRFNDVRSRDALKAEVEARAHAGAAAAASASTGSRPTPTPSSPRRGRSSSSWPTRSPRSPGGGRSSRRRAARPTPASSATTARCSNSASSTAPCTASTSAWRRPTSSRSPRSIGRFWIGISGEPFTNVVIAGLVPATPINRARRCQTQPFEDAVPI